MATENKEKEKGEAIFPLTQEQINQIAAIGAKEGVRAYKEEQKKCRKKFTKYVRNKQLGIKMPEDTDRIKYQSAIIHKATIAEDREKLWDNKKVWQALESKGFQIMSGLDVIEYTLKAGEKDRIIDAIDTLSGYESNIEEVAKN